MKKFYYLNGYGGHRWPLMWVLNTKKRQFLFRLGYEPRPLFSERNQGTGNIPIRWHYMPLTRRRVSLRIHSNGP